jgi:hypothetical protein
MRGVVRPRPLALRRTTPLTDCWGADRGTPVDRYYVERLLSEDAGRFSATCSRSSKRCTPSGAEATSAGATSFDIDAANELATYVAHLGGAALDVSLPRPMREAPAGRGRSSTTARERKQPADTTGYVVHPGA